MRPKTAGEQRMRRYLLGELGEQEVNLVEQRLLSDDEYFDQLTAVENELIDSYTRNELTAKDRSLFEKAYLSSTRRRERVEFSQALLRASPPPFHEATRRAGWLQPFRAALAGVEPARLWLAAAVVVLVAGTAWLGVETIGLRAELAEVRARLGASQPAAAVVQESDRQRLALSQLEAELERQRNLNRRLEQRLIERRSSFGPVVSFLLAAGMVRGEEAARRLVVPPGASAVRFQLDVAAEDYRAYRAAVTMAGSGVVWSGETSESRTMPSGKALILEVPAAALSPGDYILTLRGMTAAGKLEDLESYPFSIRKR